MSRSESKEESKGSNERNKFDAKAEGQLKRIVNTDLKRTMKWITFAKPKAVFGFDHLNPSAIPAMTTKTRGLAIQFEKIVGWKFPVEELPSLRSNKVDFTIRLRSTI